MDPDPYSEYGSGYTTMVDTCSVFAWEKILSVLPGGARWRVPAWGPQEHHHCGRVHPQAPRHLWRSATIRWSCPGRKYSAQQLALHLLYDTEYGWMNSWAKKKTISSANLRIMWYRYLFSPLRTILTYLYSTHMYRYSTTSLFTMCTPYLPAVLYTYSVPVHF